MFCFVVLRSFIFSYLELVEEVEKLEVGWKLGEELVELG